MTAILQLCNWAYYYDTLIKQISQWDETVGPRMAKAFLIENNVEDK
jgi:hypothetical protein